MRKLSVNVSKETRAPEAGGMEDKQDLMDFLTIINPFSPAFRERSTGIESLAVLHDIALIPRCMATAAGFHSARLVPINRIDQNLPGVISVYYRDRELKRLIME